MTENLSSRKDINQMPDRIAGDLAEIRDRLYQDGVEPLVVARNREFYKALVDMGLVDRNCEYHTRITTKIASGRRVIGVVPPHVAARAVECVTFDMQLPQDVNRVTAEDIKRHTYSVSFYRVEREIVGLPENGSM